MKNLGEKTKDGTPVHSKMEAVTDSPQNSKMATIIVSDDL